MSRFVRLALLACGGAVLAILIASIGPRVIAEMLRRVGWGFVFVSGLYAAHLGVRAAALWRSLPPRTLGYGDVLRVRLSGEAIEMLTFTGPFLAEPTKGWLLNQRGVGGAEAFGAVAIEYLLYTLVSAWMATGALSVLLVRGVLPEGFHNPVIGIVAAMIAFTVGCAFAAATGIGLIVPTVRGARRLVGRERADAAAERIAPVERVLVAFMHEHPARLVEVIAIEIAGHTLLALEIWIVLAALALPFRPADPFLIEGGVKFISVAFFFIPGQIGAAEGVYALLARAIGLPAAAGLTIALVRRIRALIVAGVGLAALAGFRRRAQNAS